MLNNDDKDLIGNIQASGKTIYDCLTVNNVGLWIPTKSLERILNQGLQGLSLANLPLRSRSKVLKSNVCSALGYPVPTTFKKTTPRFPCQNFDVYGQKSCNLQIWNQDLDPSRRYVLVKISDSDIVEKVRVVTGDHLAELDTTGTLTQKFQARLITSEKECELISPLDTEELQSLVSDNYQIPSTISPSDPPKKNEIISISKVFEKLTSLVGYTIPNIGTDQERLRGAQLQQLVCCALGFTSADDDGQCPDIKHQLIEVKLQTSPTIDLGLICPDSTDSLDIPNIDSFMPRHCDIRYVIFYGKTNGNSITLTNFYLTTGKSFFSRFPKFQGKVLNKKLQIHLPPNMFD